MPVPAAARAPAGREGPVRFRLVPPHALTAAEIAAWRRFQAGDAALASPYLCPEYARIAAAVRPDVTVAIAERDGAPVGFLAFERRGRVGGPVGRAVCDCQAIVAEPGCAWDPRAFLRAAGLSVYDFTYFRASQPAFAPFHRSVETSHAIDLAPTFEDYLRERREAARRIPTASSGFPHHALARLRQLERQCGPVRFRLHEPDPRALHTLLAWKSRQYRRNGLPDAFARRWLVALLERIHATQTPDFAGVLSTLSVGDRMVAAHMGMRSADLLHYWYPAYAPDAALARFSPGLILLLEVCRHAAAHGIRAIELGAGDEPYKRLFANAGFPVAAGCVGAFSLPLLLRRARQWAEDVPARLPLGPLAPWPGRILRRLDRIGRFR
nr:GNAT family N-acetyltransferase [Caldovatus aquaticus]